MKRHGPKCTCDWQNWRTLPYGPERKKAYKRWWHKNNPGCWRNWPSSSNHEKRRKQRREWKKRNPDAVREMNRRHQRRLVENCTLTWLRAHWFNKWGVRNAPENLLVTAATLIKLKRLIKTYGRTKKH